jgi:superfamily II DNA/RNA helicase
VFGGVRYQPQKDWLNRGVDVLVATPGRLEDLIEQSALDLSEVGIVAIDEADRMADMGFLPAVRRILDQTASRRQTLLFSATLDGDVAVLMRDYQSDPVRHDAATEEIDVDAMEHHFWQVERTDKVSHVADVVTKTGPTMVFTRTRHGADRLAKQLMSSGIVAEAMHGGRSQNQRNRALAAFVSGSIDALVATDVAARGIHIDGVATVVHFDPPNGHKDYLHRSGRTARAGARGTVVSLVTNDERRAVNRIKKSLELDVPTEQPHRRELPRTALADRARAPRAAATKAKAHSGTRAQARQPVRTQRPNGRGAGNASGKPAMDGGTVVVTNLPWSTTDKDVRRLLDSHGTVTSTEIKRDRRGRSKGVAVVKMDPEGAARALRSLEGRKVGGRRIEVRMSQRGPRR